MKLKSIHEKESHRLRNTAITLAGATMLYLAATSFGFYKVYHSKITPLEKQFRERVVEINAENRKYGITSEQYRSFEGTDHELERITQARRDAYKGIAIEDNSSWTMIDVGGDSLTARISTDAPVVNPLAFLKN